MDQRRHMLETFNVLFENRIKTAVTVEVSAFGNVVASQIGFIIQQMKVSFLLFFCFYNMSCDFPGWI
jgi:hypothetical protein